jgi:hypothetical protein
VKPAKRKKGRESNPLSYSDDKYTWLANQWFERNGSQPPSRSQILKGIINADKYQMLRLFPKYPQGHANMDKVLDNRKVAWQLLSIVSGFSEKDAHAPIDINHWKNEPEHDLTKTILYIFSMESPIRYLLQSATKEKNEDLIMDLGPFAYALKCIVGNASPQRPETEKSSKFWGFLGMPLLDQQLADIKELEPTKKEEAGHLNLSGFNTLIDRKRAQEAAWQNVEKNTTPCVIQIEFAREVDYFKLNKPEYTPYHQTEILTLLQDGLKLEMVSQAKE